MNTSPEHVSRIYSFLLKRLLPQPINRRSWKLRLHQENMYSQLSSELPDVLCDRVCIGSQYEGLSVTITSTEARRGLSVKSDYDLLMVLKHFIASECSSDWKELGLETDDRDETEVLQICDGSHPGYCKLKSTKDESFIGIHFSEDCSGKVDIYRNERISGSLNIHPESATSKLNEDSKATKVSMHVHGPALTCNAIQDHPGAILHTDQEIDVVLAIKCHCWPRVANACFSRVKKTEWPSKTVLDGLKLTPCYVVATAHKSSPDPILEWRYSFVLCEKLLAHSLTLAQRGSYILAKNLFKTALDGMDMLSSYFLKTQMFWLCENGNNVDYGGIGTMSLKLLTGLADSMERGVLIHYFIPNHNLIDHIPEKVLKEGAEKLYRMCCNPVPVLDKFRRTTMFFGGIAHPPPETFSPLTSLISVASVEESELQQHFKQTALNILKHYCNLLDKSVTNFVQEEFAKLKFSLLIDLADDLQRFSPDQTTREIMVMIRDLLREQNEENSDKFWHFVCEYFDLTQEDLMSTPYTIEELGMVKSF